MIRTMRIDTPFREEAYFIHREHSFNEQKNVADSRVLYCPKCNMIVATLRFLDDEYCWPVAQFCAACAPPADNPWFPVPGSILVEEGWGVIDEALLWSLPPELVEREFWLHIKAYSK